MGADDESRMTVSDEVVIISHSVSRKVMHTYCGRDVFRLNEARHG